MRTSATGITGRNGICVKYPRHGRTCTNSMQPPVIGLWQPDVLKGQTISRSLTAERVRRTAEIEGVAVQVLRRISEQSRK